MIRLLILDVDGTLTPFRPGSAAPFRRELLPGVEEAIRRTGARWVVLASNQGGIRKGLPLGAVHAHMRWLCRELRLDGYKFAYRPGPRKKPEPGMLLEWMRIYRVKPGETLFVGDSRSDREAAWRAGCRFAWAWEWNPKIRHGGER